MINNFFSPIRITNRELRSGELRRYATGGVVGFIRNPVSTGVRRIDVDQSETENTNITPNQVQNVLNRFIDPIKKFFGFPKSAIVRLVRRSFTQIWGTIVQLGVQLWTFDWHQTDQQLRDRIKANNQLILNAAAGALGTTLGWGAVRLVQMGVSKIAGNVGSQGRDRSIDIRVPIISGRVAAALAEEGNEEVRGQLQALLLQIRQAQTANMFYGFMLHSRTMEWFGMRSITQQSGTNDSFAQRWERKVESLPQWLQQPVENFTENFVEAIIEAGFVWASAADDQYALARGAVQDAKCPERTIVLQPDNRLDRDKYIVSGSPEFVIEETQGIINTQQLIGKRDLGYWVGEKLEDSLKKSYLFRQLKIRWNTVKKPPLVEQNGSAGRWSECNIPLVELNLSCEQIKAAADEFMHGAPDGNWIMQYKCYEREQFLGNLVVKGINESECERRVRKLKTFMPVSIELRKPSLTKVAATSPTFRSELARFYPIECSMTVRRNSIDDAERMQRRARVNLANPEDRYFEKTIKVELWPDQTPNNFTTFR
ncbi:hypothetical protein [Microseira wollei]|uniref:Uncharacterized protein n=1 Tax=Microseira wollei NIES-4236 TaxID=2530354 RepID=A0AAV3XMT3_9CYAN|nr:hypothetical protein [Microseira wollei]GET42996.1 hypothetical protein MiSe_78160 [Microseira wollei NIES-4236]